MRRYTPAFGALSFTALLLAGCKSGDKHEAPSSTPVANAPSAAPAGAQGENQVPAGVRDAKTQTLVNGFVDEAKAALSRGDAAAAHTALVNAYELDPTNEQVKTMLDSVDQQLGNRSSTVGDVARAAAEQNRVRIAQARLEVENKITESDRLRQEGDLDGAIRALQD